jgi:hypothetical protein
MKNPACAFVSLPALALARLPQRNIPRPILFPAHCGSATKCAGAAIGAIEQLSNSQFVLGGMKWRQPGRVAFLYLYHLRTRLLRFTQRHNRGTRVPLSYVNGQASADAVRCVATP